MKFYLFSPLLLRLLFNYIRYCFPWNWTGYDIYPHQNRLSDILWRVVRAFYFEHKNIPRYLCLLVKWLSSKPWNYYVTLISNEQIGDFPFFMCIGLLEATLCIVTATCTGCLTGWRMASRSQASPAVQTRTSSEESCYSLLHPGSSCVQVS